MAEVEEYILLVEEGYYPHVVAWVARFSAWCWPVEAEEVRGHFDE